jgi:hypothetical protein
MASQNCPDSDSLTDNSTPTATVSKKNKVAEKPAGLTPKDRKELNRLRELEKKGTSEAVEALALGE